MSIRIGSLFDGSGGFPLAAVLCGIEPVWASEVEPYPVAVTKSHFPKMKHLGDVQKINGADIEPVDTITFGSPCQDMSIAGKRAGIRHKENGDGETTRSGLIMEAVRIIKEMRAKTNGVYPRFIVWENVFGAFSSSKGEDFRLVLQSLVEIVEPAAVVPAVPKSGWAYADCWVGDGWSISWRTFDAQYWGVPQRRCRIYLVADFGGECAGKVLFEREGLRGYFAEGGAPWQRAATDAPGGTGICDIRPNVTHALVARADGSPRPDKASGAVILRDLNGVAGALAAEPGMKQQTYICQAYDTRGNGDGITANTITGDHNRRVTDYTTVVCLQGNCIDRADTAGCNGKGCKEDVAYTLNTIDRHDVAYRMRGFGDYVEDETASAIKQHDYKDCTDCIVFDKEVYNSGDSSTGGHYINDGGIAPTLRACSHPPGVCTRFIVRRLTPTECARLQGFPDRWGDITPLDTDNADEIAFWRAVYRDDCERKGKKVSPTILTAPDRLSRWHAKLHSESAEYKIWGNGLALPCALYVMQGIAIFLKKG